MGYLTHISIYNDGCDQLKDMESEKAVKLANDLYQACGNSYPAGDFQRRLGIGVGYHSNMINAQRPRHASDDALYLHWGNYLQCLDHTEIARLKEENPKLLARIVERMRAQVEMIENACGP